MALFDQFKRALGGSDDAPADPERAQQIAAAVLMLEMAHADSDRQAVEYREIDRQLQLHFGLSPAEAAELLAVAKVREKQSVSLYRYLQLLNDSMDYDAKRQVLEMLWRVAYADRQLDPEEEHLMRELAGLLYLPHSEFIRAKLRVTGQ